MSKKTIKSNRDYIVNYYGHDDYHQIMDCGKSIPSDFKLTGKALGLVGIMRRFPIGYKVDYADLVNRKWKAWIKGDPMFKDSDVLSATDVKKAIKGYYLAVAKGEMTFKDGSKRMLRFTMDDTGRLKLEVVAFLEVFNITEPKAESEKTKEEVVDEKSNGLLSKLEELQKMATSDAETKILENAIAELKKLHGSKVVKAA